MENETTSVAKTLKDRLSAIDEKYSSKPLTAVQKQVAGAKSSRGPGLAGRITGLKKLKGLNTALGQQKVSLKTK